MAYALVGTIGAAVQTASGVALSTWAWGASESRTVGHLLIATVGVTGSATLPTTPAGWNIGQQLAGTSCSATVYWKIAAGSDGVPTINAITSGLIAGQLAEYSGNGGGNTPTDQTASAAGTGNPITATAGGTDAATGELLVMCGADRRSVARSPNDTWTSNNGTVTQEGSNNGTSSTDHYSFGVIIGTTVTTAFTAVMSSSVTTSTTGKVVAAASFKLPQAFTQALSGNLNFMVSGFVTAGPQPAPYVRKLPLPWELLPR